MPNVAGLAGAATGEGARLPFMLACLGVEPRLGSRALIMLLDRAGATVSNTEPAMIYGPFLDTLAAP
jgi:hypothetical protein